DLRGADLRGADLRGAILEDAILRDAILEGADLEGADLRGAILEGADLEGADLRDAILSTYSKWRVSWGTDGFVRIGCKRATTTEWDKWFSSDETYQTERGTAEFERIEADYQHAKRMYEIWFKYES
ncbi:MAG: pentapeptide repeat-containing protein, partial [Anaerolineales bacterium]|nr:pentapeptide repeat-containing protein [Anaerolineales bacterium]